MILKSSTEINENVIQNKNNVIIENILEHIIHEFFILLLKY